MASIFESWYNPSGTLSYLDLKRMDGLSQEEEVLRGELMQALEQSGGGIAVNAKDVKWRIIGDG